MSDEEIRLSYKWAKNKRRQIRILSELTLKTREEIRDIINAGNKMIPDKKRISQRWSHYTDEEIDLLCELHKEGLTAVVISERLGRPYACVTKKLRELKSEGIL